MTLTTKISEASAIWTVFGILMTAAVAFAFAKLSLEDPDVVSFDALYYRNLALEYCSEPLALFGRWESITTVNWTTIAAIGATFCRQTPSYWDVLVVVANCSVILATGYIYANVCTRMRTRRTTKLLVLGGVLLQPFVILNLLSLNKESLSFLFVAVLTAAYLKRQLAVLLFAGLVFGIVKAQFALVAIVLALLLTGFRRLYVLLGFSLVIPFFGLFFSVGFADADTYFSRFNYEIRTEALARLLDQIENLPLGYLVVMPLRLVLNLLAGFSPWRIMTADTLVLISYQLTAFFFSLLVAWFAFVLLRTKGAPSRAMNSPLSDIIFAYSVVICLLPFFQLRYFFVLMPLLTLILPDAIGNSVRRGPVSPLVAKVK